MDLINLCKEKEKQIANDTSLNLIVSATSLGIEKISKEDINDGCSTSESGTEGNLGTT